VYKIMTDHGFSKKPAMEGLGAGTGEVYSWAIQNPDKVSCIYGENPVMRSIMGSELGDRKLADKLEPLAKAGVPQPAWHIVSELEEGLPVPSVVKAPDRQGQKGLTLVSSAEQLPDAIGRAIEESRSGSAIVEELVDGPEVTVNAFSLRGDFHPLTVTDRLTAEPPAFGVALAHVWPSDAGGNAAAVAELAVKALGIENGPSYTQLRVGPDGPQVIEVAARLGGGHDAELAKLALGVDLNGLALQAALGETIWSAALQPTPEAGGAIVRFLVPPEGVLEEVEGTDEARAVEGVWDVRIYRERGHVFGPFHRGADRAGAVLAVGESREEALERADEATRLIRFKVGAGSLV
jgi:biotin carboxylase